MPSRNFIEIHKKYKGKWIALTPDEKLVIVSGSNAKYVFDKARKKGFQEPILMKVPKEVVILAGPIEFYWMQFIYQEAASNIFRPIIPVRLTYKTRFAIFEAIVDSGADWCIFDLGLVEILQPQLGKKVRFRGVSGDILYGFKSQVILSLVESKIITEVIFSKDLGPSSYGILGQKGFFDNFKVCFDKPNKQLEITPK